MSIEANIAGRLAAETIIDLISDELKRLLDQSGIHPSDAVGRAAVIAPFFETLRDCYGSNLTIVAEPESPRGPQPMSDAQARAFGQRRMPWGKHKDTPIDAVPLDYLEWCASRPDEFKEELNRYLMSRRVRVEQEAAGEPVWEGESDGEDLPF